MPYRVWLLLLTLAAIAASAIAPYDRSDWTLEHIPTALGLLFLVWYELRPGGRPLGNGHCTLTFAFFLLHIVGAHFLYSRVPYDAWGDALLGVRPSEWLGATRNHYDRAVHFLFGVLALPPLSELVRRHVAPGRGWNLVVAVAAIGLCSKVYELAEWLIAVALSPEQAEAYNGQQGDMFDAQKDMGLAFLGSLLSSAAVASWRHRQRVRASGTGDCRFAESLRRKQRRVAHVRASANSPPSLGGATDPPALHGFAPAAQPRSRSARAP